MAGDTIKSILCRFLCMIDIHYLDQTFKIWELILMIKNPAYIKRVRMMLDFENVEDTTPLLMATIRMGLETDRSYTMVDLYADVEPYHNDISRENAEEELIIRMKDVLMKELENVGYEQFWEHFNMDDVMWRKKEG